MSTEFDALPPPSSPEEAQLAQALGMIVLRGMRECREVEKFSGAVGEANMEVSDADGEMWILKVIRV